MTTQIFAVRVRRVLAAAAVGVALVSSGWGNVKDDLLTAEDPEIIKAEAINQKIASLLGTTADQIAIRDLAVNPISRQVYLAVSRGLGPEATPVLLRVKADEAAIGADDANAARPAWMTRWKQRVSFRGVRLRSPLRRGMEGFCKRQL